MTQRIGILGGGISGLALAWYLTRQGQPDCEVTVLEKTDHFGGWIHSQKVDGFLFENGPRSCRSRGNGAATLALVKELGIEDQVVVGNKVARRRYLYHDGQLQQLPSGPLSLVTSPLGRRVLPALWRDWWGSPGAGVDETIGAFFRRRFGGDIAEMFADPLTTGIFAGDIDKLSVRSCFPSLADLEKRGGSVLRGVFKKKEPCPWACDAYVKQMQKKGLFAFRGGMETLVHALCERVPATLVSECPIEDLRRDGRETTVSAGGTEYRFDKVYSTLPAGALAGLLEDVCPTVTYELREIPTTTVAVANVAYRSRVTDKKGYGYLIPSREKQAILGCVWSSSVFPELQPEGSTCLTVMLGGEHRKDVDSCSEEQLRDEVLETLARHMGIRATPDYLVMKVARHAIPQYVVGHGARLERIEQILADQLPGLAIGGCSFYGGGVNDCVARSRILANY